MKTGVGRSGVEKLKKAVSAKSLKSHCTASIKQPYLYFSPASELLVTKQTTLTVFVIQCGRKIICPQKSLLACLLYE